MIIKKLTVAGFRGFNEERAIDFHDKLTVISAPNSHGKTSISEALEFLLFGITSKVEKADAKDEYRDSYRNRHYPADQTAYISAVFAREDGSVLNAVVEISPAGVITKKVDGAVVAEWPFASEMSLAAKPFVLQHALKYLLLVPPAERFRGFAQLLGLNAVESVFGSLVSLCTKPQATLPVAASQALSDLDAVELELGKFSDLKAAATALKKGKLEYLYKALTTRSDQLLGKSIKEDNERTQLLKAARADAAARIYAGDIAISEFTADEASRLSADRDALARSVDVEFLRKYGLLCVQAITVRLQREMKLLDAGVELLVEEPAVCPLCAQALDDSRRTSIHERHHAIAADIKRESDRLKTAPEVTAAIGNIRKHLGRHCDALQKPVGGLIESAQASNAAKVEKLLGGPEAAAAAIATNSASDAIARWNGLSDAKDAVEVALGKCEVDAKGTTAKLENAESLARAIDAYLVAADVAQAKLPDLRATLLGPAKLLRQAIDSLAGTAELSLIIKLLEQRTRIETAINIRRVLEGLKDLKKHSEQTLGEMMDAAMTTDLTDAVMKWYSKIKTTGDPEVHFSGFAMDRTAKGDFKSRRLSVKAESYGVELASAVSSLSESKLNALGLCVSIASAIRKPGPWSFLIIDDPIQSWDEDHATQFIDVIRALIQTEQKQVVVLSHQLGWAKQVCVGCQTLNGIKYEITGYTKVGPNLLEREWSPLGQRIRDAEAIANDATADSIRLQQAEAEVRLIACQLASAVAKKKLNRVTSPHNMNTKDVRAILIEAGVAAEQVDRIQALFGYSDDAHHAPKKYDPNAQRIRQALASIQGIMKATETS